jgi:3-methylcrotonyl-CoA carboxylase alpha subunit
MGLKREAKEIAIRAHVQVVPGRPSGEALDGVIEFARDVGYPILLKASAGGGGRGMRVVRDAESLGNAIESARREAESAFGDGSLIVEKYLERPRHVEIQILGDEHGNLVHVFERECSIQRRHQKVIEEAPSPLLPPTLRTQMGVDAVRLCQSIGYSSAGTVEFVVDQNSQYYFLEVNTRLQVEHPVTEETVYGLDLVEEQIRIARGEALRFTQADLTARRNGTAIECRLLAEDPDQNFLPQSGSVVDFHLPENLLRQDWLRIETGIEAGSEVPMHYDSMIAKIITKGEMRIDAITRMRLALSSLSVHGIKTNRAFLLRVLEHPDFLSGTIDTEFIETKMQLSPSTPAPERATHAAISAMLFNHHVRVASRTMLPKLPITGYRNNRFAPTFVEYEDEAKEKFRVSYLDRGQNHFHIEVDHDDRCFSGTVRRVSVVDHDIAFELPEGHRIRARVVAHGDRFFIHIEGHSFALRELPRFSNRDQSAAPDGCVAPMPGKITQMLVTLGQEIEAGHTIAIMEAMKMEHAIKAPHAGVVTELRVSVGEQIEGGVLIARVEEKSSSDAQLHTT